MPLPANDDRGRLTLFRSLLTLTASGLALGLLQTVPAHCSSTSTIAAIRLAICIPLLGALYSAWRSLPGFWLALLGGFAAGFAYYGSSVYWLGASANPNPKTFVFGEIVLGAGALALLVPWWAVWLASATVLLRLSGSSKLAPISFIAAFTIANVMLDDAVMRIPLVPFALFVLDTPFSPALGLFGQFGTDTLIVTSGVVLSLIWRPGLRLPASLLVVVCASLLVETTRSVEPERAAETGGAVVYLAQPALPHISQLDPALVIDTVHDTALAAVRAGVASGATLIVLPESSLLVDLTAPDDTMVPEIAAMLPDGVSVIVGFGRVVVTQNEAGFNALPYNSAAIITRSGIQQVIDKAHLVPFGETMPSIFFNLGFDVVAGPAGGYGRGDSIKVVPNLKNLPPFALLICYEAILSGAVSRESAGAEWLLNISSETLFRGTAGPRMILDHTRIRAIETGLPILRSTAHAFSGGIAPDGTVFGILAAETPGGATVALPAPAPTYFRRVGYRDFYTALTVMLLLIAVSGICARRRDLLRK